MINKEYESVLLYSVVAQIKTNFKRMYQKNSLDFKQDSRPQWAPTGMQNPKLVKVTPPPPHMGQWH